MDSVTPPSGEVVPQTPSDFGRHKMLAFGRDTLFLSHFPMFMAPHDTQLLLEAVPENAGGSLQQVWSDERASHPGIGSYVMAPERFSLSTLHTPDPPERSSFSASFFRPGDEAVPELTDVTVRVTHVIYAKKLDGSGKPAELTYRLFGRGEDLFLAHVLAAPPDFDQILRVRLEGQLPTDVELERRIEVVFPGRENTIGQRIRPGMVALARGHVTDAADVLSLKVVDVQELRNRVMTPPAPNPL